jgi:hypothetical protein
LTAPSAASTSASNVLQLQGQQQQGTPDMAQLIQSVLRIVCGMPSQGETSLTGFHDFRAGQPPPPIRDSNSDDPPSDPNYANSNLAIVPSQPGFAAGSVGGVGVLPGCFAGAVGKPQGNLQNLQNEVKEALNGSRSKRVNVVTPEADAPDDIVAVAKKPAACKVPVSGARPADCRGKYGRVAKAMKATKTKAAGRGGEAMKAMKAKALRNSNINALSI